MNPSNPWYSLYSYAPPKFPFCGQMYNGMIVDPVDTLTSFFYLFFGFLCMKLENPPFYLGCRPGFLSYIHLHSIWHLLSTIAIYYIYKFYTQFDEKLTGIENDNKELSTSN